MVTNITGSSADIQSRVLRVIPRYWFSFATTVFSAVLGGLSDSASWSYSLIIYAQKQARLATAIGPFLDIWAYDFLGRYLVRNGSNDSVFRTKIRATVLQERVTRTGMINSITALVGTAPNIFEPWSTQDAGAYGVNNIGYGVAGGWGNMNLPGQFFMQVNPGPDVGIPNVGGYTSYPGGYGAGVVEYAGSQVEQSGVTNADIYGVISKVKPTGVIAWTFIGQPTTAPLFVPASSSSSGDAGDTWFFLGF